MAKSPTLVCGDQSFVVCAQVFFRAFDRFAQSNSRASDRRAAHSGFSKDQSEWDPRDVERLSMAFTVDCRLCFVLHRAHRKGERQHGQHASLHASAVHLASHFGGARWPIRSIKNPAMESRSCFGFLCASALVRLPLSPREMGRLIRATMKERPVSQARAKRFSQVRKRSSDEFTAFI